MWDRFVHPLGGSVLIATLLHSKGGFVATVRPDQTVAELLDALARHNVGALVVSTGPGRIDGIVSERDVARHLARRGASLLDAPVTAVMTRDVRRCSPDDSVESLMATMTQEHIRHVPVVVDGALVGIVSIGDVVKSRLDELEGERQDLIRYITQ
jgi:CBS domain-containing protein